MTEAEARVVDNGGTLVRDKLWFDDGFTMLPNRWVRDDRLTFGARGILSFIASHEPGFELSVEFIARASKHGRDAVRGSLGELERLGYLARYRGREKGRFGRIKWHLRDPWYPRRNPLTLLTEVDLLDPLGTKKTRSAPATENPAPVNPAPENPTTIRTPSTRDTYGLVPQTADGTGARESDVCAFGHPLVDVTGGGVPICARGDYAAEAVLS